MTDVESSSYSPSSLHSKSLFDHSNATQHSVQSVERVKILLPSRHAPDEMSFDADADDNEVIRNLYSQILRDAKIDPSSEEAGIDGTVLATAIQKETENGEMLKFLESLHDMASQDRNSKAKFLMTFEEFSKKAKGTSRLSGQRIAWVSTLNLDSIFAKHLNPGTLFDGLRGIKSMSIQELHDASARFASELPHILEREWRKLNALESAANNSNKSKSEIEGMMSKFIDEGGFLGKFGDNDMFHAGLESEIGYPNPNLFKAIILDHCLSEDSKNYFVTGNYGLAVTPQQELARLFCGKEDTDFLKKLSKSSSSSLKVKEQDSDLARESDNLIEAPNKLPSNQDQEKTSLGPTEKEIDSVKEELGNLRKVYSGFKSYRQNIFSGEEGDSHSEKIYSVEFDLESKVNPTDFKDILTNASQRFSAHFFTHEERGALDKFKILGEDTEKTLIAGEAVARGVRIVSPACVVGTNVVMKVSLPYSKDPELNKHKPFGKQFDDQREEKLREAIHLSLSSALAGSASGTGTSTGSTSGNVVQLPVVEKSKINVTFEEDVTYYFASHVDEKDLDEALNKRDNADVQILATKIGIGWRNLKLDKKELIKQIIMKMAVRKPARLRRSLKDLMELEKVKEAGLRVEEAIVAYLYTGPLFQVPTWESSFTFHFVCFEGQRRGGDCHSRSSFRQILKKQFLANSRLFIYVMNENLAINSTCIR